MAPIPQSHHNQHIPLNLIQESTSTRTTPFNFPYYNYNAHPALGQALQPPMQPQTTFQSQLDSISHPQHLVLYNHRFHRKDNTIIITFQTIIRFMYQQLLQMQRLIPLFLV